MMRAVRSRLEISGLLSDALHVTAMESSMLLFHGDFIRT
jgi:hypothetical protein